MRRPDRRSLGLVGQVVAILLFAIAVEFGASTLLYERASQFAVREDEAHRLAEHLVVSRRVIGDALPGARAALARDLTTDRYIVDWHAGLSPPRAAAPVLVPLRRQVLGWEPNLAADDLKIRVSPTGRRGIITGELRLADGSWLQFRTRQPVTNLDLSVTRVVLALILAFIVMLLGGLLVWQTLSPLRRLARAADRFDGNDDFVVPEEGPDELRQFTRAFNDMQARIRQLIAERTGALAAVSHDLRTPLARLKLRADAVLEPDTRAAICRDVDEMSAMVSSLLAFLGGDDEPEPAARIDVAVLLATIADAESDAGRNVVYEGPDHYEMITRPSALRRAVQNLIDNAVRYGKRIDVTLEPSERGVTVAVVDDGPGIPEAMLARVIEPFVRLDEARSRDTHGFGLGLSIVARTAALLDGRLSLANRHTGGLRAQLVLSIAGPSFAIGSRNNASSITVGLR